MCISLQKSDDRQVDQDKEREKKWSILHDDYMMGAKMKDWNKESSDDDEENGPDDEMSDSDWASTGRRHPEEQKMQISGLKLPHFSFFSEEINVAVDLI